MDRRTFRAWLPALAAAAVLVSCTSGEREGDLKTPFTIAGTITEAGGPLGGITVVFLGEGAPGSVTTGADGGYEQTGFFPGTVTVAPSGDYDFLYEDPISGASRAAPVAIVIPEDAPDNTVQVDFTAMPTGASLDLLSPNGGEKLAAAGVTQIAWFATGLGAGRTVDLDYWDDVAQDWVSVASGVALADGANMYAWTLPDATLSPCFVRVSCVELAAFTDQSDSSFEVLPPGTIRSLDLMAPSGGEQVMAASALEVRWFATDLAGNTVTLEYWDDNLGQWVLIEAGVACADGTNLYVWTVPDADLPSCLVRVSCIELPVFTDQSDAVFTIYRVATLRGRSENAGTPLVGVIYRFEAKAGSGSPEPPESITEDVVGGVAESGGPSTLTDAERAGEPDGAYVGATLKILSGANAGEVRTVTLFNGATGTFTADLGFPFTFESSVEYEVADCGRFELAGFLPGTYVVTPSRTGFTFMPATQEVDITGSGFWDLPLVFVADSSAATLELLRPADGETLVVGTPFTVRWVESGLTGTDVTIEVDYGSGWQLVDMAALADPRQYSWTPTQGAALARVRLTSNLIPTLTSESGPPGFDIVWHQTISGWVVMGDVVATPVSGANVFFAGTQTLPGVQTDFAGSYARDRAEPDTYTVMPVLGGLEFQPASTNVTVTAGLDNPNVDFIAFPAGAAVTVGSPDGGETWTVGDIEQISVETPGLDTGAYTLRLEYSEDGGLTYPNLVADVPILAATTTYDWTVPSLAVLPNANVMIQASVLEFDWVAYPRFLDESDATFTVSVGEVSVTASVPAAAEPAVDGEFIVTRTGDTTSALTVNVLVSGTATEGTDYAAIGPAVTIPAGLASTTVAVAVIDDIDIEDDETVIVTVDTGAGYSVGTPDADTVTIADDEPVVTIIATDVTASETGPDPGEFTVTRAGNLSGDLTVDIVVGGTAQEGTDYAAIGTSVIIPDTLTSVTISVMPVPDADVEGNETVVVALVESPAYAIGSPASATVSLADDVDVTPPTVLSTIPADLDTGVAWDATITVNFDEAMDAASVEAAFSTLPAISGTFSWPTADQLVFTPDADLPFTTGYMVTVGAASADLWANPLGADYVFAFTTENQFTDSGQALGSGSTNAVALGDVDGDGDLDIVAGNNGANGVWTNDGAGQFTDSGQALGSSWTCAAALGDVDGDGDLDIAAGNWLGDANRVWMNDGTGQFTDSGQALGSSWTFAVALGDVDGDGDLDIIAADEVGANRVWTNDGAGQFTAGQVLAASDPYGVALGDVDGDGDLDIVAGNTSLLPNQMWLGDGAGTFTDSGQTLGASDTYSVALGDVDGDGDLDVVAGNIAGQANLVWMNDGVGTFTDSFQALGGGDTWAVALGDVDGDGDVDIVAGNRSAQPNLVWINNTDIPNGRPSAPTGLGSSVTGTDVTLSWAASTDAETPALALSYNLRVGTAPGSADVFAGHAYGTGLRQIPALGNANQNLSWTLKGLAVGKYYWSVQAIDASWDGSPWAGEKTFEVGSTVTIAASIPGADEAGPVAGEFTVTRTGDTTNALTVNVLVSGTATEVTDYALIGTSVTIPATQASATITVTPVDDGDVEGAEDVIAALVSGVGYTIGSPDTATVTISDNDAAVSPTITTHPSDQTVTEGQTATFVVAATGTPPLSYQWRKDAADIGGATSAVYTTPATTLADDGSQYDCVVTNTQGNATSNAATLTVLPVTTVTVTAVTPNADEAGPVVGEFLVTRAGSTSGDLSVNFTVSGTATETADYAAIGTSVMIPDTEATATVTITPVDDGTAEGEETVILTIGAATGYTISIPNTATVVIADGGQTVTINALGSAAEAGLVPGEFVVTRAGNALGDLSVNFTVSGTATEGVDYVAIGTSVIIPDGQAWVTLAVTPIADGDIEGDEYVTLDLAAGSGYDIGTPSGATLTIVDNEPTVTITATDPGASEPSSGGFADGVGIERVSVDDVGTEGDNVSYNASVSADGRYVAFVSDATNLVGAADTNGVRDVFVRDRQTGTTERVSVDSVGAEGNAKNWTASISADGRYVAFYSDATNLIGAADTNGAGDVFVRDRSTGTTERVSVDSAGAQATGSSEYPSISADGRYVVFYSEAPDLVAGDTNLVSDIFVRDRLTGTTERVSVDSVGTEGNDRTSWAVISGDGRYVAFESVATNLVAVDTNGSMDIFVRDRHTGTTERVSVDSVGAQATGQSAAPSISTDGRYVTFISIATDLVAGDTNGAADIFVHDTQTGATERVSVDSVGAQGDGDSYFPSISADGRYVAFQSSSANLVPGDTNGTWDIFVHDRQTGATARASVDSVGTEANGDSGIDYGLLMPSHSISADGRYVAFGSDAADLVAGDTNAMLDAFAAPNPLMAGGEFTVTRTGDTTNPLTVNYTVSGSATPGADYTALAGSVVIPGGQASATIDISPLGDADIELDETVVTTVSTDAAYEVGAEDTATVTIADTEPIVTIAALGDAAENPVTAGEFTVTRMRDVGSALTVDLVVGGTATPGTDYAALGATVVIPAGMPVAAITVTPVLDVEIEGAETVVVALVSGAGYSVGSPDSDTVTIVDAVDGTAPTVISTIPADAATGVPWDTTITINFDEDMDAASTEAAFGTVPAITGTFSWPTADQVVFTPDADLPFTTGYMVNIGAGALDLWGNALVADMFGFTTEGRFTDSGQTLGATDTYAVALADVDGDGDLDFVEGNNGANRVWRNDGAGQFTVTAQALGANNTGFVALGDVDGDGDLDIVAGNYSAEVNLVWINDGTGQFTDSGQALGGVDSRAVALGDVDGDGDLDIVAAQMGPNLVWFNDGTGTFSDSGQTLGSGNTYAVPLGDVDGDGDLDIVAGNTNAPRANRVWVNDGTGTFTDSGQALGGSDTVAVALGDVDGDGDLDYVVGNGNNQANLVWINDGAGTFTDSGQTLGGNYTLGVALGDVDGDGDLDFVAGNISGQANLVWTNDGAGQFTDSGQALGSSDTYGVALGDVDGDGDLDIAAGNYTGQANLVWLNLTDVANTVPSAPTGLASVVDTITALTGSVTFTNASDVVTGAGTDFISEVSVGQVVRYDADGIWCEVTTVDSGTQLTLTAAYTGAGGAAGLGSVSDFGGGVQFSWAASTDAETPAATLSYNMRVGSTPGGSDVFTGHAYGTGLRKLPALGNASLELSWILRGLPAATYYWSVQAIDACWEGSPWAGEKSFTVGSGAVTISATDAAASETGPDTGTFTVTRSGSLVGDLTVNILVGGSATEGTDYAAIGTSAIIPDTFASTTILVAPADDGDIEPDETVLVAVVSGAGYAVGAPDTATVTIADNETPIIVTPTTGLVTTEGGAADTFTVVLVSAPTADVTIGLTSSDVAEGSVSPVSLTFTAANWSVAQTVTVTGADDSVDDDDAAYTIVTAAAVSADPTYSGADADDVSVTNTDNDTAGITVTPVSGLIVDEMGATAQFTIVLDTEPTADVTVNVTTSDVGEGVIMGPSWYTFTAGDWSTPQTVTIQGADDTVDDGDVSFTIVTLPAESGELDIIAGDYSGVNRLYPGNGDGTFAAGVDVGSIAQNTEGIALADLDGDGFLDLVEGNMNDPPMRYLNNGDGTFASGVEICPDTYDTQAIAAGDLNGDGWPDVVAGNLGDPNRVYLNDGGGAFGGAVFDVSGLFDDTYAVELGDVDGDEVLDLVVGNYGVNRLHLGNGDGTFAAATDITADSHSTNAIALGDMDGDGDLDIIAGNATGESSRLYRNNGDGTFPVGINVLDTDATQSLALGDVDGDGDLDVAAGVFGGPNQIYLNNGDGTTAAAIQLTGGAPATEDISLGDVDGDGDLDLVAAESAVPVQLYLGVGDGTFLAGADATADPGNFSAVALAELNGDGDAKYRGLDAADVTVTCIDDDASPTLAVADVGVAEDGTAVTVTVTMTGTSASPVTVDYATADATAVAPADYLAASGTLTWTPGQTGAKTFQVAIANDVIYEGDETFDVNLSGEVGATVTDALGVVTITDDDAQPTLAVADVTVGEADGSVTVAVTMTGKSASVVTVEGSTVNDTALAGSDYTAVVSSVLTWNSGETGDKTFTVDITDDAAYEGDESFFVDLVNPAGATISDAQAVVTITDDDGATVTITATDAAASETAPDAGEFTVTRAGSTAAALTVNILLGGSATEGTDYAAIGTSVVIADASATATVAVTVVDDGDVEVAETVTVALVAGAGYTVGSPDTATVTISDDDAPDLPMVTTHPADQTVTEGQTATFVVAATGTPVLTYQWRKDAGDISGATSAIYTTPATTLAEDGSQYDCVVTNGAGSDTSNAATLTVLPVTTVTVTAVDPNASESGDTGAFTVTRAGSTSGALSVNFTVSGSATSATDYASIGTSVNISGGQATATVTVTPVDDTDVESDETVQLTLAAGAGYTIDIPSTATVTISDNEPVVTITTTDGVVDELGDTGEFTVTRAGNTVGALTVNILVGGSAAEVTDYSAIGTTVVIPDTFASTTITVDPVADSVSEADETVIVALLGGAGYTIGSPDNASVTIIDTTPTVAVVTLNTGPEAGGTAVSVAGTDFVAGATVTFGGNPATGVTFISSVQITCTTPAGAGVVDVTVTNPNSQSGTLAGGFAYDTTNVVTISATGPNANEEGPTSGEFTVTRTGSTSGNLTVTILVGGTATEGADYAAIGASVTIPDGSASTTITVSPVDDGDAEGDETVICVILSGAGYDVGAPSSATVTVGDNEGFVVTITASDPSAAEPVNPGVFTVSRTGGTSGDLSVNYNVGGTATSGTDYASIGTSVTIPGGQASATITVTPIDNTLVEGTETVVVTLALGAGYSVGAPSSDAVTILDDDDFTVTITASDPNAAENPLGTGSFAVSRTGGTLGNLSVNYNVGGTAAPGTDYVSIGASVTIPAGQVAATITVTPNDDAFVEGAETVVVTLAGAAWYVLGSPSDATVTIADGDQFDVTITANDPNADESGDTGMFTVSRTGGTAGGLTVNYNVGGSAASGTDYVSIGTSVIIPGGQVAATITVTPNDDGVVEAAETVVVTLAAGAYTIGAPSSDTVTIADDDDFLVSITATDANASEPGADTGKFAVSRAGGTFGNLTVNFAVGGTATSATDYASIGTNVMIPAGQAAATITVTPNNDAVYEGAETVIVTLAAGAGYSIGAPASDTVTIADDEPVPQITIAPAAVTEANGSLKVATATLSQAAQEDVTVEYSTTNGTAVAPADYTAVVSGTITFPATQTTADAMVTLADDAYYEGDETFTVTLASPSANAVLGTPSFCTVTITDDEPVPQITIAPAAVMEADGSFKVATATLSQAAQEDVTVEYSTTNVTAVAPGDYTAVVSGVITIPATQTTADVMVTLIDDDVYEGDETFTVTLANPSANAVLGTPSSCTVTITDDESEPTLAAMDAGVAEDVAGGTVTVTVTMTGKRASIVTVDYGTADNTATVPGGDYAAASGTLTWTPGETGDQTFTVPITNDSEVENSEIFYVNLTLPVGATITDPQGDVTINDDDDFVVTITASDASAAEAGADTGEFTVSRTGGTLGDLTVNFTVGGTAAEGTDYAAVGTSVTILAGQASAAITVTPFDDGDIEGDETVVVSLSAGVGYTVGAPSSDTVTIADDDSPPCDLDAQGTTLQAGQEPFARAGDAVNVTSWYAELDGVDATAFDVTRYLSYDDVINPGSDTAIGTSGVAGLTGGTSSSVNSSDVIPPGTNMGPYYVGSFVDSGTVVAETDETNNIDDQGEVVRIDVLPEALVPGQYDLLATEVNSDFDNGEIEAGASFVAWVDVASLGDKPVVPFRVGVYISVDQTIEDGVDYRAGWVTVNPGDDLENIQVSCTAGVAVGGPYYLGAIADYLGQVGEVDETNNASGGGYQFSVIPALTGGVDIEPDGFDGPEPTAMEINQPAYVSIRIGVRGNRATGAFFYRLYVTTLVDGIIDGLGDDIPITLDLGPENLAPGAREEVWVPVTLTAAILPGDYILGYVLDSVGDVAETDETNNAAQTSGTMTVYSDGDLAAGADLIVILEDPPEGPPPPPTVYYVTDGATSIPWPKMITANFGTRGVGAGVTDVRFYLSPDMDTMTPGDDFFLGSHTCAALDAGKYQFLEPPAMDAGNQLDFTGIGSGIYYLFAVIDEGFVVDEMDEANNTSEQPPFGNWIEVDILGAPQPDIYARTMRADDSTYSIEDWGTEVWGRVTVQNTALDVGCPASAIALYISTDNNPVIGGGDVFLAAYPCGLLGPGEIAEGEIRGRLPFTPATGTDYYMKLVVDALDEVVEMDEGNNVTASEAFQFTDNRTFPGGLDIERVSVDFGGGDGDAACYRSSISSDGRYVAFDSSATDLVAGDGNGVYDVFVRDRQTDATTRVSVDSGGGQGFGNSTTPSISADGRYVAFQSLADTLVGGDTNTVYDVFVHDRQTGETTRVSVDSGGIEGDNASSSSSISADGRYVAFSSLATNLVLVDGNGSRDVFVHDRQTGTTEMVSVDTGGTEGNGNSNWPSISADGRYVAFESLADNLDLMLPDVNGVSDIFVHDRLAGETTRVSVDSGGSEGNNASYGASISAYGRYVAFESLAWNLVPGDGNGFWDIFVRDRQTLETTRASLTWTGGEANGDCLDASISSDGQYVAFQSWSDILVPGDGNAMRDIFVRDRQASQTVRVSVDAGGGEVNGDSYVPAISGNGRYVAFGSDATNLVIGDGNSVRDIFAAPNPLAP